MRRPTYRRLMLRTKLPQQNKTTKSITRNGPRSKRSHRLQSLPTKHETHQRVTRHPRQRSNRTIRPTSKEVRLFLPLQKSAISPPPRLLTSTLHSKDEPFSKQQLLFIRLPIPTIRQVFQHRGTKLRRRLRPRPTTSRPPRPVQKIRRQESTIHVQQRNTKRSTNLQ